MAFDLTKARGYGTGNLGNVTLQSGSINHYGVASLYMNQCTAQITKTERNAIDTSDWTIDTEVLFILTKSPTPKVRGTWEQWNIVKIQSTEYHAASAGTNEYMNIVFDQNIFSGTDSGEYEALAVTIPHYKNLTLNSGCVITPPQLIKESPNSGISFPGGVVAFKCQNTLTFNGGHINLSDATIYYNYYNESLDSQCIENKGILDTDKYSGWENSDAYRRFLINQGDGAVFIIANTMKCVDNQNSRIGNPNTTGVQFCRGSQNSPAVSDISGVTNIGGSTILIAANTINDSTVGNTTYVLIPSLIAKYRNSSLPQGKGLARCYIASDSKLRNDEGLYAYDCMSKPNRVSSVLNVKNFGNGRITRGENPTNSINNYATVTNRDENQLIFTCSNITSNGQALFEDGALVMVHYNHKDKNNPKFLGEFYLAKISTIQYDSANPTSGIITLDYSPNHNPNLENYNAQIITIPQYHNFILSTTYSATPAYDGRQGGICALACSDTCDLRDGLLNMENKGGGKPYERQGLRWVGNAQDYDKLPIGQGHGSIFILAQNLVMNANTRIGGTQNGAAFGGGNKYNKHSVDGGGYRGGKLAQSPTGYITAKGNAGWGGGGGAPIIENLAQTYGGYGSNGDNISLVNSNNDVSTYSGGKQGAHIMIIADTITGFNQAAISTGGGRGGSHGESGGAGYGGGGNIDMGTTASNAYLATGGGGGYNGGGGASASPSWQNVNSLAVPGGSSGWAFIYCNTAIDPDYTDVVSG